VLRGIVRATERESVRKVIGGLMRKDLGVDEARALPQDARAALPLSARPWQARGTHPRGSQELSLPATTRDYTPTAAQITIRYRDGGTNPLDVTERALRLARNLAGQKPSMGPILHYDDERCEMPPRAVIDGARGGPSARSTECWCP